MKIEELRKIADTAPANLCIQVCRSHFEALIAVAEIAEEFNKQIEAPFFTWDGWQVLHEALKKLKEIE